MPETADMPIYEQAIKDRLHYDPATGILTWRDPRPEDFRSEAHMRTWRTRFAGQKAGKLRPDGYISVRITVDGVTTCFLAHRIAWFVAHGRWPEGQIDHVNGVRTDNRIENLRDVSPLENRRNMRCYARSQTGVAGVTWSAHAKRWMARINTDGRQKNLGYFLRFEDAVTARERAAADNGYRKEHGKRHRPSEITVRDYIAEQEQTRIRHASS